MPRRKLSAVCQVSGCGTSVPAEAKLCLPCFKYGKKKALASSGGKRVTIREVLLALGVEGAHAHPPRTGSTAAYAYGRGYAPPRPLE